MVFPPLADDFFVSPGFIHFSPSATLPAINKGIFWNTVRQQNASFSLAFDCFQSEMNRFKPKYFAKREWLSLSHPDSFFMLLQGPAVFLVNSACYFWALMHKCSPHTHTEHSWVLAVNLRSISRFNGMVLLCLLEPEAARGQEWEKKCACWVGFQRIHRKERIGKLTGVMKVVLRDVGGKNLKQ